MLLLLCSAQLQKDWDFPPVGSTVDMFHWDSCLNNFFLIANLVFGKQPNKNHIC